MPLVKTLLYLQRNKSWLLHLLSNRGQISYFKTGLSTQCLVLLSKLKICIGPPIYIYIYIYLLLNQMLTSDLIPIMNVCRLQMHSFLSDDCLHISIFCISYSHYLFHNICSNLPDHFSKVDRKMYFSLHDSHDFCFLPLFLPVKTSNITWMKWQITTIFICSCVTSIIF